MNKVMLSGRMTRDVEANYTNGDKPTCNCRFSVAVTRRFKNSEGKYDADFINCVAFGPTAEFISKYFKKADGIELSGRIVTGSYINKDGVKIYTTEVAVDEVGFPPSAAAGSADGSQNKMNPANAFMSIPDNANDEGLPFN